MRTLKTRPNNNAIRLGCGVLSIVLIGFALLCSGLISGVHFISNPFPFIMATIFASFTAVPYFLFLWWLDRNEPEPVLLLLTAFFWGAFVSTPISGIFNDTFSSFALQLVNDETLASQLSASLSAPFIEEITKGLALLVLFVVFIREFDNLLDGILYGGMIGLGFAWFENILYYMKPFMDGSVESMSGDAWGDMFLLVYMRGLVSAAGGSHVAFTALTGLGFGLLRHKRNSLWVWGMPFVGLGFAMLAHFAWNSFAGVIVGLIGGQSDGISLLVGLPLATVILQGPFTLFLLGAVWFAWSHEEKIIRQYLQNEPESIITPLEYQELTPSLKRTTGTIVYFFKNGFGPWRKRHLLGRAHVELAFAKWHNKEDKEIDWSHDEDAIIVGLREQIIKIKAI